MCPHEEKLTAWLLGDLPPGEQEAMTRHVDGCATCRAAGETLSRVLSPLRSGLAKDREWHVEKQAAARRESRRRLAFWLWHKPHEGLKRAALVAVSFGTLFALLSTLYQSAQREAAPAGAVTTIEFKKRADETVPALEPMAAPGKAKTAPSPFGQEGERRSETFSVESKPVPYPAPPAAEPHMPQLRRLPARDASLKDALPAAVAEAPAAPGAPAPRQSAAQAAPKRERAKSAPVSRPPADLLMKPTLLAGAPLALTNALATNTVPTNAAPPKLTSKP